MIAAMKTALSGLTGLRSLPLLIVATLCLSPGQAPAQSGGGSSLGDLLDKVKDIKVPESVSSLPKQLAELKESYLKTAETVEALRTEVAGLREEVAVLKADNAQLREAVGMKSAATERADLLKPVEIAAPQLAQAWLSDRDAAAQAYSGKFLRVVGSVESLESVAQEVIVILKTDANARIRCHIRRDASFHAEVLASQGRVVDRNDRRTILAVGQPVAVLGTCDGFELDVRLSNCRIEGLEVRKQEEPKN